MSAGSHTEPGGYTGAGKENLHRTDKGKIVPLRDGEREAAERSETFAATGQFDIADQRSPREMAEALKEFGYEPVWKDWDATYDGRPHFAASTEENVT
jgi:2-iminoacetate synthase